MEEGGVKYGDQAMTREERPINCPKRLNADTITDRVKFLKQQKFNSSI